MIGLSLANHLPGDSIIFSNIDSLSMFYTINDSNLGYNICWPGGRVLVD